MEQLTRTENKVADLIADAMSNKQIAEKLGLTEGTVKEHIFHIYQKLNITAGSPRVAFVNIWRDHHG